MIPLPGFFDASGDAEPGGVDSARKSISGCFRHQYQVLFPAVSRPPYVFVSHIFFIIETAGVIKISDGSDFTEQDELVTTPQIEGCRGDRHPDFACDRIRGGSIGKGIDVENESGAVVAPEWLGVDAS